MFETCRGWGREEYVYLSPDFLYSSLLRFLNEHVVVESNRVLAL